MNRLLLWCLFCGLGLLSCNTLQPGKPARVAEPTGHALQPSLINIPMDLEISTLEKILNRQFSGLIYEDNSFEDNGGDMLMVKAWKKEDIRISLNDNVLTYRVPLKLWIKAGWKIERFGFSVSDSKEMNAEIALDFSTAVSLNHDWTFSTSTVFDGYEWLSTPVMKLGPVNLPITRVADLILKTNQKKISREIDKAVAEHLSVRKNMQAVWETLQKPVLVNEDYNVWLRILPMEVYSSPITGKSGRLKYAMGIRATVEAFVGGSPAPLAVVPLPELKTGVVPDESFVVNFVVDLPYGQLNAFARQYLVGQKFQQDKYSLLVKEADVYPGLGKLVVHLQVSGSIRGDLYFTGVPVYDVANQSIKIESLDFDVRTRNALVKTGSWLFRSKILSAISKNLVFPMKDYLQAGREVMEQNLGSYPLSEDIELKGRLDTLGVDRLWLADSSIKASLLLKGKVVLTTR